MIFETDKDRYNEKAAQRRLERYGYEVIKTGTLCPWDLTLSLGGEPHAIVEFKARNKLWDPLKVDAHKLRELARHARDRRVKPIFMISVPGPEYWFVEINLDWPTSTFTRKRNAQYRQETPDEVFEIPKRNWKKLE